MPLMRFHAVVRTAGVVQAALQRDLEPPARAASMAGGSNDGAAARDESTTTRAGASSSTACARRACVDMSVGGSNGRLP